MISWLWLIPAFLVGLFLGVTIMACMAQAGEADERMERMMREIERGKR